MFDRKLLARIEGLRIATGRKQRALQRGERSSLRKGAGTEFSDFRPYLQGDDIRRIDWNLYARSERLFLKLFLEEESRPSYFLVDGSESMNFGDPTKFRYSLRVAACLSYISLRRYDPARILVLRGREFEPVAIGSRKQFFPVLERLEEMRPGGETCLSAALRKISLARFPRGVCFLLSDFYSADGLEGLKLLGLANEIHCLHLLSPGESHPDWRGDLRLVDSETNAAAEVSMSALVQKRYAARLAEFRAAVKKVCGQAASSYLPVATSTPIDHLLLHDLKAAGLVI